MKVAALGDADQIVPYQLDTRREKLMGALNAVKGEDAFGRLFMRQKSESHNEAVAIFRYYAVYGDNEALRAFARITLPFLEHRLAEVNRLP